MANMRLREKLKLAGFYEVAHTPGLWKHRCHPIQFFPIVDDFGVKYVGKEHIDYLIASLRKDCSRITVDWKDELYAGIHLKWNYEERWLDASMNGYVSTLRQRFSHKMPQKPQHSPYRAPKQVYGAAAQAQVPGSSLVRKPTHRYQKKIMGSYETYVLPRAASDKPPASSLTSL